MDADRFVLRLPLFRCWVYMFVYADRAAMLRAANRWRPGTHETDIEGIYQTLDGLPENRFLGVVRLVAPIDVEVVLHECVHVAIHAIRFTIGLTDRLSQDGIGADEEMIAHAISDCQIEALAALNDGGYHLMGS